MNTFTAIVIVGILLLGIFFLGGAIVEWLRAAIRKRKTFLAIALSLIVIGCESQKPRKIRRALGLSAAPTSQYQFRRSDANGDDQLTQADVTLVSSYLAGTATLSCLDAADANDDGVVDAADVAFMQRVIDTGGQGVPLPPPPLYSCGTDPTPDSLDCTFHAPCPEIVPDPAPDPEPDPNPTPDPTPDPVPPGLRGVAIVGDSDSDEYRADDNRGGAYSAVTFNWVEVAQRLRPELDFGTWGTWGGTRRTGYEFNWARSGATIASVISGGQHTGIAAQVAAGRVSHVVVRIGINDFHPSRDYADIYSGALSGAALDQKLTDAKANLGLILATLLDSGATVICLTVPDAGVWPLFQEAFPDEAGRQRVTDAVDEVNSILYPLRDTRGLVIVDSTMSAGILLARSLNGSSFWVGCEEITMTKGNEPHNAQLGDGPGHMGTVASGLGANMALIQPLRNMCEPVELLTDQEILGLAGILVAQTDPPDVPTEPEEPVVSEPSPGGDPTAVRVAWDAPTTRADGSPLVQGEIEFYRVRVAETFEIPATQTTFDVVIPAGEVRHVIVTAVSANGESADSEEIEVYRGVERNVP